MIGFANSLFRKKRASFGGSPLLSRAAFFALLVFMAGVSARATTWYVDNSLSGGSNNGTSWANAWHSISAVSWNSISPGDTIYISGGSSSQVYSEVLNSSGISGTSAKPITISVGQDSAHSGQVIIDGTSLGGTGVVLGSYQILTGNVSGQTNFVIRNVTSSTLSGGLAVNAAGISAYGSSGITVANVEIHSCTCGMEISSCPSVTISNCYLYDIQGDVGIGLNGSSGGYDANIIHNCSIQVNSAMNGSGGGPDAIQASDGVSVYNCNITSGLGTVVGGQHQDGVQFIGNYLKVYNNTISDCANSCVEGGCGGGTVGYYMIYNNVFQINNPNVDGLQRGVEWSPNGQCTEVTDVYICNNTFVDIYGYYTINWIWSCSSCTQYTVTPSMNNFVVENNIIYNSTPPYVQSESGANISELTFDYNAVWAGANGSTAFSVFGASPSQPHLQTGNVQFVSYSQRAANNNLHLAATDTVARGHGIALSSLFTTDKDGNPRPSSGAWDIGAYQYATTSTNPVITVTPGSQNFGTVATGSTATTTFTVENSGGGTLTGSASVAAPFSIVAPASYSLTNGQSQVITVEYSPTVAGTNTQNVSFAGGGGATASVTGAAIAPLSGLTFPASAGVITSPFILTNGYIYQPIQTLITNVGISNCGTATYAFTITNAGEYVVDCLVLATNEGMDSFYVNIDATPTDPYMIWKILPLTTGFQEETVTWEGNGAYDAPEFSPQVFNLSAGSHQLIIAGREQNTELEQISIVAYAGNSTNPVMAVTPTNQNFGTIATGSTATATFTVENTGGGTLAGTATVASPFSIASGASYSLTNGQSQVVTVQYSPTANGTNAQTVTFSGGGGATASVTGSATTPLSGLIFPASAATITAPFILTNGYIYQPVQTLITNVGISNCGTATFTFSITNAGNYVVQALVNAPANGNDSFYVNIDANPTDPYMIWKILPVTAGFQEELVSWQGTGTYDTPEFVPATFNLTAGTHQLIIVGREMNTQLEQVSILKIPSAPTGLHIVPGS